MGEQILLDFGVWLLQSQRRCGGLKIKASALR